MTNWQQFWEFCIQEAWRSEKPLHQKELVDALIQTRKKWAEKSGMATEPRVCRLGDATIITLWMCGLQQAFGWLHQISGGIGTATDTNSH